MSNKPRKLWLSIHGSFPDIVKPSEFWGTLRASIRRGDYELPDGWDVTMSWRNRADRPMKSDGFSSAMEESAGSSTGWERVVLGYIDRQLARVDVEPRSVPAIVGARTKREHARRLSDAARRGWVTRRAHEAERAARFAARSAAARRGWDTRRGRG